MTQDIFKRIDEIVLQDNIEVEQVELGKDHIKVKVKEFKFPSIAYKCVNEIGVEFHEAYESLKPFINEYKNYKLPNEKQLLDIFEREKKEKFLNVSSQDFTEEMEEKLKEEVLARPSIEKILIKSVEKKQETNGDTVINYYVLKVQNKSLTTACFETDECVLYAHFSPNSIKDFARYEAFQAAIDRYFFTAKEHYLSFLKYLEEKRENKKREAVLNASQGHLFPDLSEFEKKILTKQAKKYFPEKFKGNKLVKDLEEIKESEDKEPEDLLDRKLILHELHKAVTHNPENQKWLDWIQEDREQIIKRIGIYRVCKLNDVSLDKYLKNQKTKKEVLEDIEL